MAYLEEDIETILHDQQMEMVYDRAMRERLEAHMQDYAEYSMCMAFHPEFRKTEMTFNQWSDMKYNNLKHIRQWAKKVRNTTY